MQKLVVQGPLGAADLTTYNYNSTGDLTSVTNALGQTTTYSGYNGLGQVGSVSGPNGDITSYAYYPGGKLKSITTYPNGSSARTASFTYSSGLLATSAVNGITTTYTYDSARRLLSESHNELNGTETTQYTYNAASDPTRVEIYRNSTLRSRQYIDYDELGRVIARRGNNGQNVAYAYDNNGNVKTVTDSLGRTTTLAYDPLNRVISSKNPKNGYTKFYYDNGNRVTQVIDPRYLATTYAYDGFGQLWSESSPDRGTTTYSFAATGLRTQMKRANNAITTYGWDGLGRPTSITAGGQTQTFAYDTCTNGKGRLCSASESNSIVQYAYEPDGRVRSRTDQITVGTVASFTTGYAYDSYGRLTTLTYPNGQTVNYNWSTNQINSVTTTIGGVASTVLSSISYEPFGAVAGWTYGNGIVTSRGFDTNQRQTSLLTTGSTTLQNLGYGYNANDLITSITNAVDSGNSKSYGYDELSRLLTDTGSSYTYDANGNRLTSGSGTTYTIGSTSNRLTGTNALGTSTFVQDTMGNTTTYAITGFGSIYYNYDAFNRMSSVSLGGSTLGSYAYNALGQRTSKVADSTKDRYVYGEDWRLLGERRDGTNAWTNYLWFGGQPVAVTKGSTLYMLHDDHLGRPELATNASKSIVWKSANSTFGGGSVSTNSIGGLNLGLPGQYFDAESGLWYNMNRYYDPLMGRYTQVDPIGLGGGVNPYVYAGQSPILGIDPFGLYCLEEWQIRGIAGAVVGGAGGAILGSESGPAALITGLAGALVNGGLGVVDGLLNGSQANGTALGAVAGAAGGETKLSIAGGGYGGAIGGAVSSQMEADGYSRPVSMSTGGAVGGSVGSVISAYFRGLSMSSIAASGLKGGGIGLAAGAIQAGLESAIRDGNDCGCKK